MPPFPDPSLIKHFTFQGSLADLMKNLPAILKGEVLGHLLPFEWDTSEEAAELAVKQVNWDYEDFRLTVSDFKTNPTAAKFLALMKAPRRAST